MKPILFNTEMVKAILEGRKTVTRRVVKPQPIWRKSPIQQKGHPEYWANWDDEKIYKSPYRPGNILYVRETFCHIFGRYVYRADYDALAEDTKSLWRPSIHMPREAARIFLRVTDVRVERLWEMGKEDAMKEGITPVSKPGGCRCQWAFDGCMEDPCPNRTAYEIERYMDPFYQLWQNTIKPADLPLYGWAANPWVWVVEFERISKEEADYG